MIELLLRYGADIALQDSRFHSTPLGWADHHGARRIFDLLAPLAGVHDAVRFGLLDRLKELLRTRPSLANARDTLGRTPLHYVNADDARALEIVEVLLSHGAEADVRDAAGESALDRLAAAGRSEIVAMLRQATVSDRAP